MPRPIAFQIASVRHLANERPEDDTIRQGAEDAITTLEWFRDHRDLIIAGYRLWQHPAVPALFEAFPSSEFESIPDVKTARSTEGSEGRSRV